MFDRDERVRVGLTRAQNAQSGADRLGGSNRCDVELVELDMQILVQRATRCKKGQKVGIQELTLPRLTSPPTSFPHSFSTCPFVIP